MVAKADRSASSCEYDSGLLYCTFWYISPCISHDGGRLTFFDFEQVEEERGG